MGSTVIINRTSSSLEMKTGNHRFFANLATVGKDDSYTVTVDRNDTYQEFRLEAVDKSCANVVTLNSDECVDNMTLIIKEAQGKFYVEREPRLLPRSSSYANSVVVEEKKSKWYLFWS